MKRLVISALAAATALSTLAAPPAHAALYSFTSHTFTTCGTTGPAGPSQATCRSQYSTTWDENSSYYSITGGIQYWTVPATGRYYIDAYGAGGGGAYGGGGARIADTFDLVEGEVIRILVGQIQSEVSNKANAGGGGTFVVRSPFNNNGSILVVAGGGGGTESGASQNLVAHASITTSGNDGSGTVAAAYAGAGGTNGSGGTAATTGNGGGAGGGFLTDGATNAAMDNRGGIAFVNGGGGGPAGSLTPTLPGGFGGGGASRGQSAGGGGPGGGGGYSGGGGGDNQIGYSGGGGGSYFANGLNINRVTTVNANPAATSGTVTISYLAPASISLTIANNSKSAAKGNAILLTSIVDQAGRVTFYANRKRIAGCINMAATVGTKTCSWKPTSLKVVEVYATLTQNGTVVATSTALNVSGTKRTGLR